jgi:Protein of unknown function (DUF3500)
VPRRTSHGESQRRSSRDGAATLLRTYLANHPGAIARDAFARIDRAGIARTRFGWAGSTRPGLPQYYRLQGPTFLLEFDNSRNSGTHIHSVWRDFDRDFGAHLL